MLRPENGCTQVYGFAATRLVRDAISRPELVPDMDDCAKLAAQFNRYRPMFNWLHAMKSARMRRDVVRAVRVVKDARRLHSSLHQIQSNPVNLRLFPGFIYADELQWTLTKFLEPFGRRWRVSGTKAVPWIACADAITPHIVDTLRKAGWRKVSPTYKKSPVIAILAMLIGAVMGDEPPDPDSLGSTLRQAAKKRKKARRK